MGNKIVWTKEALELYLQIINYLSQNFSEKEVAAFTGKVDKKISLISRNPAMYRASVKLKNVYRTVISREVVLIYRYKSVKKEIQLLQFWDTRRNPRKAKF
jgi:plasmid stabilization system protein ParE